MAFKLLTIASMPLLALATDFQLFAYGTNASGLNLFYSDGLAFVGNVKAVNTSNAANVVFSKGDNSAFVGRPDGNTTAVNWSNLPLCVPSAGASSTQVGFCNSTASGSSFTLFEQTAALTEGGALQTLWGVKESGIDGVFGLHWNDTTDAAITVALRSTAPSTGSTSPDASS